MVASFDTTSIRAAHPLPDYCRSHGIELRGHGNPRGCCPIHGGDNREGFSVFLRDGEWHWRCHTGDCGGGDVIDLHMELRGCDFSTACAELGGEAMPSDWTPRPTPRPSPPPPEPLPELSAAQRLEMDALSWRLGQDEGLCEALAASRGWELSTVRALACSGALGWMEQHPHLPDAAALCFLYPHAVKIRALWFEGKTWRWHRPDGGKHVSWLWQGWPWNSAELWREDRLRLLFRNAALITEGEPDALSAVDVGAETQEQVPVALPSASLGQRLRDRLPSLLRGYHIKLCADQDDAGSRAAVTLASLLKPISKTFTTVTL